MEYCVYFCVLVVLLWTVSYRAESIPLIRELRLSLEDVVSSYSSWEPEGPGTYAFGYDINDPETENMQFRDEERKPDGSVIGKYGWVAADGMVYIVSYVADQRGYRADIMKEPSFKLRRNPIRRNGLEPAGYSY